MLNQKFTLNILVLLLTCCAVFSQVNTAGSGWSWYNPEPIGNDIFSFSIAPDGTQYLCGKHGTLLKSTNGGLNFTPMGPVGEKELREIITLEASGKIIVVGEDGARLSIDGGASWLNPLTGQNRMNCVTFNGSTVLIGGDLGKIWRSTNNGNIFSLVYNNPTCDFQAIIKVNSTTEIAVGTNGKIYRSLSGVWDEVNNPSGGVRLNGIHFINSNTGVIVGNNNMVMTTTNGGLNWNIPNQGGLTGHFYDVTMADPNTIITAGEGGKIYRSTNFGQNWQSYTYEDDSTTIIYSIKASSNYIYASGSYGIQLITSNNGANWERINANGYYDKFLWVDVYEGFRSSASDTMFASDSKGGFYRSSNGGDGWIKYQTGTSLELSSGHFVNSQTGWLVGGRTSPLQRIILKTTNGGVNWVTQHTANSGNLYDVHFFDQNTGIAAGNLGAILRTTNSGFNWQNISGVTWTLNSLYFFDANTGIAAGESGKIFRTTNQGLNWQQVNTGGFFDTQLGVDFVNTTTGVSVGSQGRMYRTTNGGLNWAELPQITQNTLHSISFADALTGYACGSNLGNDASVLKTTDAGLTWQRQNSGTDNILYDIRFVNSETGFAVGEGGTILKTTRGGIPIGIQQVSSQVPDDFRLHQNYPNPFNPVTKIRFDIPAGNESGSNTSLYVYDITGKLIGVLADQSLKAGSYEYTFNAFSLPSGVYFYMLRSGNFTETKKMILIK